MKKYLFILFVLLLCAFFLYHLNLDWAALFHGQFKPALHSLKEAVASGGQWKYALFLFLFITLPMTFVPVSFLCLAGGVLFDAPVAALLIWTGAVCSAAFSFLLARTLLRRWVQAHFLQKLQTLKKLDEHAGNNGFVVCLISRFLPFPYVFPAYAAGLSKIRMRDFVGATALGMLPWSVFYAVFSQGLVEGSPRQLTIGLSILGVIFAAGFVARKQMFGKKTGVRKEKPEVKKVKKRR